MGSHVAPPAPSLQGKHTALPSRSEVTLAFACKFQTTLPSQHHRLRATNNRVGRHSAKWRLKCAEVEPTSRPSQPATPTQILPPPPPPH